MIACKHVPVAIALVGAMTATLRSEQGIRQAASPASHSPVTGQALIYGKAVDMNGSPLQSATLRLRNLASRNVEQVATPNHRGEFTFAAHPDVPYVVEIVDKGGRVLAVGDIIVVQAGEVAAVTVSIPTRLPETSGLFADTAPAVISAVVSAGLTVLPSAPPLSPER